jgi:hypothetical protein
MVKFIDPKNGLIKSFPTSRTTIDEVEEWNLLDVMLVIK